MSTFLRAYLGWPLRPLAKNCQIIIICFYRNFVFCVSKLLVWRGPWVEQNKGVRFFYLCWWQWSSVLNKLNGDFCSNRTFQVKNLAVTSCSLVSLESSRQEGKGVLTIDSVLRMTAASCHQKQHSHGWKGLEEHLLTRTTATTISYSSSTSRCRYCCCCCCGCCATTLLLLLRYFDWKFFYACPAAVVLDLTLRSVKRKGIN